MDFRNILISSLFGLITATLISKQQMGVKVLPQPVGPLKSWLFAGHFLGDVGKCFRPNILPVNSRERFFQAVFRFWKRGNPFKNQHLHMLVALIYSHQCGWESGLWFGLERSHRHTWTPKPMWSLPVFLPRCLGYIPERGNNTYTCRWDRKFGIQSDINRNSKRLQVSEHIVTYSSSWRLDIYETKMWRKPQFLFESI